METLFLSERANTNLFRTSKIFEIDALFVKLEGFLYWSQVLETFHAYLKHTCMHVSCTHGSPRQGGYHYLEFQSRICGLTPRVLWRGVRILLDGLFTSGFFSRRGMSPKFGVKIFIGRL